ncbi:MAG: DUF1007 family protein [Paracoccaceae bacterium]
MKKMRFNLIAALSCLCTQLMAHPHEFYDSGADFTFDEQGRLASVRIVWIYDAFTSLYVLSEHGLDPTVSPQGDALDALLLTQVGWTAEQWDGDAYLNDAQGRNVPLGDPRNAIASVYDGRLIVVFERPVLQPVDMSGGPVEMLIYDPGFYAQYDIVKRPRITGRDDCQAEIIKFRLTPEAALKLTDLMSLTIDETPDDPNVGAEFSDRVVLRCAP